MTENQKKFIVLRASGKSFDAIAKEINVSKSTLIAWSRLYDNIITKMQFEAFLQIKEEYLQSTLNQYKQHMKHLSKVDNAITDEILSNANAKDLFVIRNNLIKQIEDIEDTIRYHSGLYEDTEFGSNEIIVKLSNIHNL